MANTRMPHALCVLVLAAMGIGCGPTTMPLPMHAAGYRPAQASANDAAAPGGERTATLRSALFSLAR